MRSAAFDALALPESFSCAGRTLEVSMNHLADRLCRLGQVEPLGRAVGPLFPVRLVADQILPAFLVQLSRQEYPRQ